MEEGRQRLRWSLHWIWFFNVSTILSCGIYFFQELRGEIPVINDQKDSTQVRRDFKATKPWNFYRSRLRGAGWIKLPYIRNQNLPNTPLPSKVRLIPSNLWWAVALWNLHFYWIAPKVPIGYVYFTVHTCECRGMHYYYKLICWDTCNPAPKFAKYHSNNVVFWLIQL